MDADSVAVSARDIVASSINGSSLHTVVASSNNSSGLHAVEKRDKWCNPFFLPRPQPELFLQIPAAWQGGAAEGPSAAEIASSTTAQQAFQVSVPVDGPSLAITNLCLGSVE